MELAVWVSAGVGAYFLGSIPTGYLLARGQGVDIFSQGSGNIGATNVARTMGKRLGVIVLFLDMLKGAGPMLMLPLLSPSCPNPYLGTTLGVAVISGHCFSPWLKFRGGKGVATSLGVFLVVAPYAAGLSAMLFTIMYLGFRIVAMGSIAAAIALPAILWMFQASHPIVLLGICAAFIVLWQHRSNIGRIVAKRENQL